MEDYKKTMIKEMANDIKKKMEGATLMGEKIDFEDSDFMVVAAYQLARNEIYGEKT